MTVALQVRRLRTRLRWERTSTFALRAGAIAAPLWVAGCVGAGLRVGVLELAGTAAIGAAWGWRGALDAVGAARRVDALLGLEDRVLTAWTTRDDPRPMAALARRDAAAAWAAAPAAPLAPRWPWGLGVLVVALLVGAATWRVTMPGGVEGVVTTRRAADASSPDRSSTSTSSVSSASSGASAAIASPSPVAADVARPLGAVRGAGGAGAASPTGAAAGAAVPSAPGLRGGDGLRLGASGLAGSPGSGTPDGASAPEVAAARRATPQLPERYRPVVLRYLAERRP